MNDIPEPIRTALMTVAVGLIAALGAYLVALLKALTRKAEAAAALDKNYLGAEQAQSAVAAVDQTMDRMDASADKLARAVELAPAATLAQIEAEVQLRRAREKAVGSDGTA